MTVTFQVVAVLLRLRIDGPTITRSNDTDWAIECERLLGVVLTGMTLKGGSLKLMWLRQQFT